MVIDNGTPALEFEEEELSFIEKLVRWFKGTKVYAIIIEISRL
jgi:hypothetical protein